MSHPPEDVVIAAELREPNDVGVCGAEISEEAADGSTVVVNGFEVERSAEIRLRQLQWAGRIARERFGPTCAEHEQSGRSGWSA